MERVKTWMLILVEYNIDLFMITFVMFKSLQVVFTLLLLLCLTLYSVYLLFVIDPLNTTNNEEIFHQDFLEIPIHSRIHLRYKYTACK